MSLKGKVKIELGSSARDGGDVLEDRVHEFLLETLRGWDEMTAEREFLPEISFD